ncbi:hypothetical protein CHS0354_033170 [Potamilus streckersoni]|uniref:Caskin-1 n=1 Tax=Potamilus streckersoni TaxID=2493646 RepID=A0AAE0S6D7_9BIVA|nr:hypothetical protein CHS0354_033170 [Potamilus streckersoni]
MESYRKFGMFRLRRRLTPAFLSERLLLQAGVNVNRVTLQGTALHEAAPFGKIDVVRLLIDCGVDVNKTNSYDQTALDIVNKLTTNRAAKEIKQLLKEASFAVRAKAVKDYCNIYDPNTLAFKEGDLIKILEQGQDGVWKGSLLKEGRMAKTGFFPADHVVLIDNNALVKRNAFQSRNSSRLSAPPHVPDILNRASGFSDCNGHLYSSIGHDESFPPPPSPLVSRAKLKDTKSLPVIPPPPPSAFHNNYNVTSAQNFNGKVIVNHLSESYTEGHDYSAAWDIRSSSPCKDSPTNSNRNSAASSDSGRGLSANCLEPKYTPHSYVNVQINNHHRLSGTSYESGVSSRQSYHSTSSSSVGSLDRLEESGYSSQINVAELFHAGVADHEVLRAWLSDLHYEEYHQNFIQAGYDMPTITHMTPQDLTAIGITKPGHRKKLKAELNRLNIPDGIPDFKPNDLYEWLHLLNLSQYYEILASQGYDSVDQVTEITWEDLEEIGIQKLGHQKKIMLAIDRLKRINSGVKRMSTMDGRGSLEMLEPPGTPCSTWSGGELPTPPPPAPPQYDYGIPMSFIQPRRSSSGDSLSTNSSGEMRSYNQQDEVFTSGNQPCQPDVIAIQVKRSMSHSAPNSFSDGRESNQQPKMCQSFHAPERNILDFSDRENTPTGDDRNTNHGTLNVAPLAPKAIIKPKPVAKIVAKTKRSSHEDTPDIIDIEKHEFEKNMDGPKSPIKNIEGFSYNVNNSTLKRYRGSNSDNVYDRPQMYSPKSGDAFVFPKTATTVYSSSPMNPVYVSTQMESVSQPQHHSPKCSQQNSPTGKAKKNPPPPPPKRTHSVKSGPGPVSNSEGNKPSAAVLGTASSVPSVPAKPTVTMPPQQQAFVNCVQSLAERFGKKSEEISNADAQSSDGEDLPPPPPPVAMDLITPKIHNYGLLGKSDKTSSGEYMLQQRLKREGSSGANSGSSSVESVFGVKLQKLHQQQQQQSENLDLSKNSGQENGSVNIMQSSNKERKDSTGSNDGNMSSASSDSNTLPFANENVGTIKQRIPPMKPSIVAIDDSIDGEAEENTSVFTDVSNNTLKRIQLKPIYSASVTATVSPTTTTVVQKLRPPVPVKPTGHHTDRQDQSRTAKSGDVLREIDNMLQGLTEELEDAMLEFEITDK